MRNQTGMVSVLHCYRFSHGHKGACCRRAGQGSWLHKHHTAIAIYCCMLLLSIQLLQTPKDAAIKGGRGKVHA